MEQPTAPQRTAPVQRLRVPPPAPVSQGLTYRWGRLREDQRERALGLVTHAQQRRRRERSRVLLITLALLVALVVVVGLVYLVLSGVLL